MKPLHLLALATALALSSPPMVLANDTNFILRLSPNGTLTWPAPTAGADRYHVQSSGTLLEWQGVPGLTNVFPTAATLGRFSFALPGFPGTVATQSFYRVLAEGLAGETCSGAELLSFPAVVQHTTVGYRDDTSSYLSLPALPGPDRHYRLRLPGQWRLSATLMPEASFDPALVLFSATNCGAIPLPALAAVDASGAGGGETLLWSNATPTMVDVILAVDSAGTSGTYALELAAESLLPGDSPFVPESLPGAGIYLGTTVGYANDISGGVLCQGTAGLDHFYRITLSAGQRLQASVEPTSNFFDPSINLLRPPTVGQTVFDCLVGDDSGTASTRNQVLYNNPGLGSEDVLIAIDTYNSVPAFGGGPYRLEVQLGTFPAGDVLRGAQILAGAGTVNGNLTDYVNDLTAYPGWSSLPGRDRFYRVAVPAGQRMVATLTPTGFNAALAVLDATALDATNLVLLAAADASASTSGAETAAWFNATAASRDVILAVDTDLSSALGSFTLAVQFNVPPAGDVPPTAELLAGPGTVSGTTVGFLNDTLLYPGLVNQPGNDRFYRLTVPAGLRLAATVSNVSFNASIVVLDAEAAASGTLAVLAFANDSTSLTGAEKVFWLNAAATNREVVIAVESPAAGVGGTYTLTTDVAEVPPGETPLTAELLAGAGTATGFINGYANDLLTYPAWQSLPGPDRFFRVTVPAGERLVAALTPSGFDAALGLLDASAMDASNAVVVLAAANNAFGPTGAETTGWVNLSDQTRDVIVAVETSTLAGLASGSFTLALELGLPPVGERPQTAELLAGPGTVPGTTVGFLNDVSAYPGFSSQPGNDRFYRLSVPPGLRLSATVSNVSFNVTVVILDGAAAAEGVIATLALASRSFTGAETAFWLNRATTNREVVIGVESFTEGAGGTYTLTTVVAEPPPGDSPFVPEALPGPGTYTGTTTNYANDVASGAGCVSLSGADRYYQVNVPAGERLRASLTSATANFNPSLNLLRPPQSGQTTFSCLVGDDTGDWTATNSVSYLDTNAAAENILIAIDTAYLAAVGDFSLTIEIGPPPPPPPGEFPHTAEVLSGPGTISGSTTNYANDLNMPSACTGTRTPGRDRFYQIVVPAGKELVATVTPIGSWDVAIYLIRASEATNPSPSCLDGANWRDTGQAEGVNYLNETASDELIIIGVDSYSLSHFGNFTLETILMP